MNNIENWITKNKLSRSENSSIKSKKRGLQIKNVIPPVFESYALIYHPYEIPVGKVITEKEAMANQEAELIKRINLLIEKELKIPAAELPTGKYDIEAVIGQELRPSKIEEKQLEEKIEKIGREGLKMALEPLQNSIDAFEQNTELHELELKEISWQELFGFYGISFNNEANWQTISRWVADENRIIGQEMPEMDYLPRSVIKNIIEFLSGQGISKVAVNSDTNSLEGQDETANFALKKVLKKETVSLVASPEQEWIIINPYDCCRTIVAGKLDFVSDLMNSNLFETSSIVDEDHWLFVDTEVV